MFVVGLLAEVNLDAPTSIAICRGDAAQGVCCVGSWERLKRSICWAAMWRQEHKTWPRIDILDGWSS